jgi:aminopeptidase N
LRVACSAVSSLLSRTTCVCSSADTAAVPLQRYVCHELAHYWSSGAVSSGPENWLNEAFAEFVAARYVRTSSGADAYATIVAQWREQSEGQPPVWKPELTRRPTARTEYRKAPYLLDRLEERVGTATMDRILVRFMTEPIRTTPALLEMIGRTAGAEAAAWFREQLAP